MAGHRRARQLTGRTRWLIAAAVVLVAAGAVAVERATSTGGDDPTVATGSSDLGVRPSPSRAPWPPPGAVPSADPAPDGQVPDEALPIPEAPFPAPGAHRPPVTQVLGDAPDDRRAGADPDGPVSSGRPCGGGTGGGPGGPGRDGSGPAAPRPGGPGADGPGGPHSPEAVTVVLYVSPTDGPAHQDVTLRAAVAGSSDEGTVSFWAGGRLLGTAPVRAGVATLTTNVLGAGVHDVVAVHRAADGRTTGSRPVTARYGDPQQPPDPDEPGHPTDPDEPGDPTDPGDDPTGPGGPEGPRQTILVRVPTGALVITTPYGPQHSLDLGVAALDPVTATFGATAPFEDLVVTDTRPGRPGYTLSVVADPFRSPAGSSFGARYAGLTDLVATRIPDEAVHPDEIRLRDNPPLLPGLSEPRVVATYPAGLVAGATRIDGVFQVDGVPSSVRAGRYTTTVTFTAI